MSERVGSDRDFAVDPVLADVLALLGATSLPRAQQQVLAQDAFDRDRLFPNEVEQLKVAGLL